MLSNFISTCLNEEFSKVSLRITARILWATEVLLNPFETLLSYTNNLFDVDVTLYSTYEVKS